MEKVTNEIVEWLQKKVKEAKASGLVVGVSGGLDSAVVAFLMQRAFPKQSMGVIMPLKSSEQDISDAEDVVTSCGIAHMTIDLTNTHEQLFTTVVTEIQQRNEWNETTERIADANLRARLRMSTLYTIASNYGYLVAGTDNAAEWYTGYFTKYGDGGVDLQPIVDLTKREVREIAEFLGVPKTVIHKEPSADLWTGQTDEEEMGTTYDNIDAYLVGKTIPEKDREIITRLHLQSEHKRHIAPHLRLSR